MLPSLLVMFHTTQWRCLDDDERERERERVRLQCNSWHSPPLLQTPPVLPAHANSATTLIRTRFLSWTMQGCTRSTAIDKMISVIGSYRQWPTSYRIICLPRPPWLFVWRLLIPIPHCSCRPQTRHCVVEWWPKDSYTVGADDLL